MRPDSLPPLRDVIEEYGLGARKSLGQHFLLDMNITRKIAGLGDIHAGSTVLEVGPGPGGLTRALLETGSTVFAIERDRRCIDALSLLMEVYTGKLNMIEDDALTINEQDVLPLSSAPSKSWIVSNLPYNISTELLVKWLKAEPVWWAGMVLMFQKEVADRITATPGNKSYGRLSVISQVFAELRKGFNLPARAFTPPPKVDSSVLIFRPVADPGCNASALEKITAAAFSQRRKMLRSSLKGAFGTQTEETLLTAGLKPTQRAEEVSAQEYVTLANLYAANHEQ